MTFVTRLVLILLALLTPACGDTIVNLPTQPTSATSTSPTTPVAVKHTIQFRVLGNATSARIRYSTPLDGLAQVVTSLPYFNTQSTTSADMFLSLEASPLSYGFGVTYPFMTVQIVVDNAVFREASSQDFLLAPLTTSGQWRQ